MNVNLHFFTLALDRVFTEEPGGALAFHPTPMLPAHAPEEAPSAPSHAPPAYFSRWKFASRICSVGAKPVTGPLRESVRFTWSRL